jgi:fumarate hydratase, class II
MLTGLPFISVSNKFVIQGVHDALIHLSSALRTLAAALHNVANDIRATECGPRADFSELLIPGSGPGSSIVPGKVNAAR